MTQEERKIRFEIAVEIINKVYVDMCNDNTGEVSRKEATDFCNLIIDIYKFKNKVFPKTEN